MTRLKGLRTVAFAIAGLLSTNAHATGDEDPFLFGDQANLLGGAVTASIRDTAAIWYNPAGLAQNNRARIDVSGTALTVRLREIPAGLSLDLPSGRVDESIESHRAYVVPTTLAVAREITQGVILGLGLFVTEQDLTSFVRSVQLTDSTINLDLAGALTGTVIRYHVGLSLGYQINSRLRVGATLFGVYEDTHEFRKLFANASFTNGMYQSTFFQRLVDASTTRYGAELLAGAQLDVGHGWELGLTARSPRLIVQENAVTDNSTALISTGMNAPTVAFSAVDHTPIGAEGTGFTRPPRFTLAAAKQAGSIEVSAEAELRPSGFGPTSERTVINGRSGVLWKVTDQTQLGLGIFTNRSGAGEPAHFPDYRVDYYGLSAGFKHQKVVGLHASEHAPSLLLSTTIAVRYAIGLGDSTRIRFDFRDAPNTGLVGRVDDERVNVVYHDISLYLGTGLDF